MALPGADTAQVCNLAKLPFLNHSMHFPTLFTFFFKVSVFTVKKSKSNRCALMVKVSFLCKLLSIDQFVGIDM